MKEIQSILVENDISPFEVTQSGLVPSLLAYLTRPDTGADQPAISHPQHSTTPATSHTAQVQDICMSGLEINYCGGVVTIKKWI